VYQFKDGGKSPHLKKLKTIIHPGEVRFGSAFHMFLYPALLLFAIELCDV
jgi:hypothetical protein